MSDTSEWLDGVRIAVVGLGYVGLPLAVEFGKKFPVTGFDIRADRIAALREGRDETLETEPEELRSATQLRFSTEVEDLRDCTVYIVTVPTPIDVHKSPDLRPLLGASETVGQVLKPGDTVIFESTVYPGCTEEDCVPVLERISGLKFNRDFTVGYGLALTEQPQPASYDGIVLAVAHDEFRNMGIERLRALGKQNHVLYDLKYIFASGDSDIRL